VTYVPEGFVRSSTLEPSKPIFTQSMADAGELPPVGAECNICCDSSEVFFKGSVLAYFEDLIWLNMGDRNPVRVNCEVRFKPLDDLTEKQKAVYDMKNDSYQSMDEHGDTDIGLLFELLYEAGYRKQ
jgi:hypothetical protein